MLLFTLDLLGLTQERAASIAEAVGRACGLPSGQVVIACTHTHSGPSTLPLRGMPYVSEGYFDYLTAQMVRAGRAPSRPHLPGCW